MKHVFKSIYGAWLLVCMLIPALGLVSCSDDDEKFTPDGPVELKVTLNGQDVAGLDFGTYGGNTLLTLETNAPWSISVSDGGADWLILSNRSGDPTIKNLPDKEDEPRYIKFTVLPLGKGVTRSCTVTFKAAGEEKSFIVTQLQPEATDESGWETAISASRNMGSGINLYNTLDACGNWFDWDDIVAAETCWGQPLATQGWFDAVAAAGFKGVRVPVTWYLHLDADRRVKEPWMNRVEEVVNYALNAGLYCILNVHHDTGAGDDAWVRADLDNIETISEQLRDLWTQIATRFKDYDSKLLFEGYNEMLDAKNSWVEPVAGGYEAVNILAQQFVDAVRATGGNNIHRNLIVNTYGGGGSKTRLDNMVIPSDKISGHLLVEVHNYTPSSFSNLDGSLDEVADEDMPAWTPEFERILGSELDLLIEFSNTNGVPVIIGECGAYDRIPDEEKAKYGKFITNYAQGKADINAFFWGQLIDRTTYQQLYPLFISAFTNSNN